MASDSERSEEAVEPSSARQLFQHRDFVLFISARGGMIFGMQIVSVAVGWHVYEISGSVLNLGLIGLAQFLPILALFLVAGVAADRIDRKLIFGCCYFVQFITSTAIGFYLLSGPTTLWPIFVLLAIDGGARAFSFPALQATLPNIVPREVFANAIAVSTSVTKIGQLAGPALAGVAIALIDRYSYFLASSFYAVAMCAAFLIQTRLLVMGRERFSLDTLLGGFRHIWREKIVFASISIDLVAVLFGSVMGLLPVFTTDILQVGPEYLGILRGMPALGGLVVGLALARTRLEWHVGRTFFVSLAIFGLSILVFCFSTNLWLSLLALAIYGAVDMFSVYVRQTLIQLKTPDALRGRVSAVNSVSINASNELGDFRAGTMAAFIGTVPAVAVGACMTLLATALWWRWFPDLRRLERI